MDIRIWTGTRSFFDIVIDGSGSYDLDALLSALPSPQFYRFEKIYIKSGNSTNTLLSGTLSERWENVGVEYYDRSPRKDNIYAIDSNILYVDGTGFTLTMEYVSPGVVYPMVDDLDEPKIMLEYSDIIVKWAITKFLKFFGDMEQYNFEKQELSETISLKKKKEARENKRGRTLILSSHNRTG